MSVIRVTKKQGDQEKQRKRSRLGVHFRSLEERPERATHRSPSELRSSDLMQMIQIRVRVDAQERRRLQRLTSSSSDEDIDEGRRDGDQRLPGRNENGLAWLKLIDSKIDSRRIQFPREWYLDTFQSLEKMGVERKKKQEAAFLRSSRFGS